jgi:hypothetical protein
MEEPEDEPPKQKGKRGKKKKEKPSKQIAKLQQEDQPKKKKKYVTNAFLGQLNTEAQQEMITDTNGQAPTKSKNKLKKAEFLNQNPAENLFGKYLLFMNSILDSSKLDLSNLGPLPDVDVSMLEDLTLPDLQTLEGKQI